MTRIEDILRQVRYALADPNKERYTDARLLDAISDGQKDIARQTRLLKGIIDIPLDVNVAEYSLPSDLWLIERVHFNQQKLPLQSFDRMDARDCNWYNEYGRAVEAIIYDKRNMHKLRVYPRPDNSYIVSSYVFSDEIAIEGTSAELTVDQIAEIRSLVATLAVLVAPAEFNLGPVYQAAQDIINITPVNAGTGMFGVVTSVENSTLDSAFGVLTDLEFVNDFVLWPGQTAFNSLFGVATEMLLTSGYLHIMYIKDAPKITSVFDELEVAPIFDTALQYFAIGKAFGDDLDTQYQQRATLALEMYDREIVTVGTPTDETDGTRSSQYTGAYIGPFS